MDIEQTIRAAEQGDAEAQYHLGVLYDLGEGVLRDRTEAVKWYRLSAEQGHADAQYSLGWLYDRGFDVPQDYTEAVKWYRLAAEQWHMAALSRLNYYHAAHQTNPS